MYAAVNSCEGVLCAAVDAGASLSGALHLKHELHFSVGSSIASATAARPVLALCTSTIYEGAILHVAGWTFRKSGKLEVRREGAAAVYGIPYSEHSNFTELRHCVAALRPKRIIPTVNVTDSAR